MSECLGAFLGGRGAAVEDLESRASELSSKAPALIDRAGAVPAPPKN